MKYFLNIQLLEKKYFIRFDIYFTYIFSPFFPCRCITVYLFLWKSFVFIFLFSYYIHLAKTIKTFFVISRAKATSVCGTKWHRGM